jgi:SAM-dependent methyltransferase
MRELQEGGHPRGHAYRTGSPHLEHSHLYERLVARIHTVVQQLFAAFPTVTVLDVGAGHGSFSEPLLAFGCRVVATEMSQPSLAYLKERYAHNPNFSALLDDGSLSALGNERFSLVLYASVLHHIPDYVGTVRDTVERHVSPGGAVLTFQDPLWYPAAGFLTRAVTQLAYFSWRIGQGDVRRGLATRLRRARGIYRPDEPADMVEYHVTRRGVDERRLAVMLSRSFADVSVFRYWSTQSRLWQGLGESLRFENTFGVLATGYDPTRAGTAAPT